MRSWRAWSGLVLLALLSLVMLGAPLDTPHGVNPADLDRSCAPCADFNKFANGGWEASNPIPAAYPSWGVDNEVDEAQSEYPPSDT